MGTFVLDSSAILRFLEAEADRVKQFLYSARRGECLIAVSAVDWGEVVGVIAKRQGRQAAETRERRLERYGLERIPVTSERAVRSAFTKLSRKIAYADAFCIELAGDSPEGVLVAADLGMKLAEADVRIEFLPTKSVL